MSVSHKTGPDVIFGQAAVIGSTTPAGGTTIDYNPHFAPSAAFGGMNLLDYRGAAYSPGQPNGTVIPAWVGNDVLVVDQIPWASTSNNIASTAGAFVAGGALALVTSSGVGVVPGVSIVSATSGQTVTGLLSLDGSVSMVSYAPMGGSVQSYDPRTMVSRAVTVTNQAGTTDATTTYTVVGFDVYNYRMSDAIVGATAGSSAGVAVTATGKKGFKYIQSVTPSGTSASTWTSVGTADIVSYPLTAYEFALTTTMFASATITGTGYTQPSTYTTATSTSGDARGTYTASAAFDGSGTSTGKKLMMQVFVPPWAFSPNTSSPGAISSTGLLGVQA